MQFLLLDATHSLCAPAVSKSVLQIAGNKIERSAIIEPTRVEIQTLSSGATADIAISSVFSPTAMATNQKGGHVTCYPSPYSFSLTSDGWDSVPTAVSSFCNAWSSSTFDPSFPPTATTNTYDQSGAIFQGLLFIEATAKDNCTTVSFDYGDCISSLLDIFNSCQQSYRSYFVGGIVPYFVDGTACGDFVLAGFSGTDGEDPSLAVASANHKLGSPITTSTTNPTRNHYLDNIERRDTVERMATHSRRYRTQVPLNPSKPTITNTPPSHVGITISRSIQTTFSTSSINEWPFHHHNHHLSSPISSPGLDTSVKSSVHETSRPRFETKCATTMALDNSIYASSSYPPGEKLNRAHQKAIDAVVSSNAGSTMAIARRVDLLSENDDDNCIVVPVYGAQAIIYSTQCAGATSAGPTCVPCEGCEVNQCIPK